LATEENLRRLAACGGRFVIVMPRTRKEDGQFRQLVRQNQVQWEHPLSRKNNRRPESKTDHYGLAQGNYQASGYRLLWIRSTQKAQQDAQSRARRITQTLDALRQLQTKLNTYRLKCRPAIEQALHRLLDEQDTQDWIGYQIQVHRQYEKHFLRRGRPAASQEGQWRWTPYFSVSFNVDRHALEQEALTDGVFPLITNLETDPYTAKRVLEIYKFQPFLEKRHSQPKTWQEVTPVLLKKDDRVVAYLHMHVMALMVAKVGFLHPHRCLPKPRTTQAGVRVELQRAADSFLRQAVHNVRPAAKGQAVGLATSLLPLWGHPWPYTLHS
jgi:transposase